MQALDYRCGPSAIDKPFQPEGLLVRGAADPITTTSMEKPRTLDLNTPPQTTHMHSSTSPTPYMQGQSIPSSIATYRASLPQQTPTTPLAHLQHSMHRQPPVSQYTAPVPSGHPRPAPTSPRHHYTHGTAPVSHAYQRTSPLYGKSSSSSTGYTIGTPHGYLQQYMNVPVHGYPMQPPHGYTYTQDSRDRDSGLGSMVSSGYQSGNVSGPQGQMHLDSRVYERRSSSPHDYGGSFPQWVVLPCQVRLNQCDVNIMFLFKFTLYTSLVLLVVNC